MIKLQKELVDTTAAANSALSKAATAANEALIQQEDFLRAVQALQKRLSQDLKRSSSETQSYLQVLTKSVKDGLENMVETFTAKISGAERDIDELSKVRNQKCLLLQVVNNSL